MPGQHVPAEVAVEVSPDGVAVVGVGSQEGGTGRNQAALLEGEVQGDMVPFHPCSAGTRWIFQLLKQQLHVGFELSVVGEPDDVSSVGPDTLQDADRHVELSPDRKPVLAPTDLDPVVGDAHL